MAVDHNNPQSRNEEILIAAIDGKEYNKLPQSRIEELLLELKEVIEAGSGGGTTNYNLLSNLPKINNITVKGDMTAADLSLVLAEVGKGLSTNDYSNEEKAKVANLLTAIQSILDGSDIDSFGDVEVALLDKADTSDLGTAAAKDSTNSVTAGSTDLVESGAVKDAIDTAVAAAYHHAGTKTVAQLTHDLLIAANEGNVYNITDSGTTTSDFIEGIGKQIDAGDNVGICKVGNVYMFDLLSGFVDTTNFVQKSQTTGLLNNDGTVDNEIKDDVDQLKSGLTNVQSDVKLNTNDLTTPSRTKNLIPITLAILKTANTSGTWSGNVYTAGEVTYTVNTDSEGHVTSIDYSNSSTVSENQLLIIPMPKDDNNYLFNGGISGDCFIFIWDKTANARAKKWDGTTNSDNATSSVFKEVKNVANHDLQMLLRVSSGVTAGSGTLYPMLCKSTETDPAFAPYIPSVDARLEAVESGLDEVQGGLSDIVKQLSGIYSYIKNTFSSGERVTFELGDITHFTALLFYTSNAGHNAIYAILFYKLGQTPVELTKLAGETLNTLAVDNTTGSISLVMDNWSSAVLLTPCKWFSITN